MQRKATIDSGNEKHRIIKSKNEGILGENGQIKNKVCKSVTLLSSTDHSTPQKNMSTLGTI